MPYFHDSYEGPGPGTDWDQIEEIYCMVRAELMSFYVESKDEAMAEANRPHKDINCFRHLDWSLVPFRKTNDEGMLEYYLDEGRKAADGVGKLIEQRQMTGQLLFHWGKMTACHGFVLSAALANGTDLGHERAGAAAARATNRDAQRRWFAQQYFRAELEGLSRPQRTDRIAALVNWILENDPPECREWETSWFEKLVNVEDDAASNPHYGQLYGAFSDKKLSQKDMKALLKEPADDLPPIDLKFPTP